MFRVYALPILLKTKKSLVKQWVISRRFNPDYLLLCNFLLEENEGLTQNTIGNYRGWHGISRWQDMFGKNFFSAEVYLDQYRQRQDPLMLDKLIASLYYRPLHAVYAVDSERDYDHFSKWPMDVKLSILTFYVGARKQMHATFKNVFKAGKSDKKVNAGREILKLRSQMAQNDLSKTDIIDRKPIAEILFQLEKDIEDAHKRAEQLSKRTQ